MKKVNTGEIAAWKIDSPLERFLARKADRSSFWKKRYVSLYKRCDSEYYKKGLKFIDKNIKIFLGELPNKQKTAYEIDMVYSLHRFGCMFDEYFLYNFPSLCTQGRESFITDKIRWNYYAGANRKEDIEIFNDKKKCYDLLKKYYGRELILISSAQDQEAFTEFASKHKKFIVKPYNSSGGRGVHILNMENRSVEECFRELLADGSSVVCEELIVQSEALASFHPSSVNTLRLTTIHDKDGVHLFHPLLRTGVGNAVVDNASSGGIFALVDPETGIVCTEAKDEKTGTFLSHPDTGVVYPGFRLPDWEQAVTMAKQLAMHFPHCHYVGWDLAHTDKGWVIVEGNPRGQLIMMQLFFRNGFKDEFERHLQNM